MPQIPHSLSSIIQTCRPHAALLTSFTFSPSYFEATVLSKLKQTGCQDVVLLVDQNEVLSTLAESRSLGAGRSYRLLSVASPGGGFFHPKIAYLECEGDDILVVGSGNLTFSGQGNNLECIDAVKCSQQPAIFAEFALWLEALSTAGVSSQVAAQLQQFCQRAQAQAKKFANNKARTAWLIHTAHETAFDQLTRIALAAGAWSSLCVLSPFHAPDGSTILQLADAIGVRRLEIGVNAVNLEVALNEHLFKPALPVCYVLPDYAERMRTLHAKWFELRTDERTLIMSGSVNATPQSMQSRKNVEISLARLLPCSPFDWEEVKPSGFSPNSFTPPAAKTISIGLDASFLSKNKIDISLHKTCKSQTVTVALQCAGKILQTWEGLDLHKGSTISAPLDKNAPLAKCKLAITVHVDGADFQAAGYLNIEPELTGQELVSDCQAALARIADGQEQAGDSLLFLQLLWQLAHEKKQHTAPTTTPAPEQAHVNAAAVEQDKSQFSYREWVSGGKSNWQSSATVSHEHLIKSLASLFSTNAASNTGGSKPLRLLIGERDGDANGDEWESSKRADEEYEQKANYIDQLREMIPVILKDDLEHTYAVPLILFLLAAAMDRYRVMVQQQKNDLACAQCMSWLQLCSELKMTAQTRAAILPSAVALAALIAHYYQLAAAAPPFERLRALLDIIVDDKICADDLAIYIMQAEEQALFARLSTAEKTAIAEQAPHLANAASMEEILVNLVIAVTKDHAWQPDAKTAVMFPSITDKLRCRIKINKPPFGVLRAARNGKFSCPCCGVSLHADFSRNIKQKIAVICNEPSCGKVILCIQNQFLLDRLLKGTSHV